MPPLSTIQQGDLYMCVCVYANEERNFIFNLLIFYEETTWLDIKNRALSFGTGCPFI